MQVNSNNNKITIHQLPVDNGLSSYSYIIELSNNRAILVDPVGIVEVEALLLSKQLIPIFIFNTHGHSDHIEGNGFFVKKYSAEIWAHPNILKTHNYIGKSLANGQIETIEGVSCKFIYSPGHTEFDISLLVESDDFKAIFTGDTIFNLGVGNCHNGGNAEQLCESVNILTALLDDDAIVLPGHDYFESNLKFTLSVEGKSKALNEILKRKRATANFFTTIKEERSLNLFMKCKNKTTQELVGSSDSLQSFVILRRLKDGYR